MPKQDKEKAKKFQKAFRKALGLPERPKEEKREFKEKPPAKNNLVWKPLKEPRKKK